MHMNTAVLMTASSGVLMPNTAPELNNASWRSLTKTCVHTFFVNSINAMKDWLTPNENIPVTLYVCPCKNQTITGLFS